MKNIYSYSLIALISIPLLLFSCVSNEEPERNGEKNAKLRTLYTRPSSQPFNLSLNTQPHIGRLIFDNDDAPNYIGVCLHPSRGLINSKKSQSVSIFDSSKLSSSVSISRLNETKAMSYVIHSKSDFDAYLESEAGLDASLDINKGIFKLGVAASFNETFSTNFSYDTDQLMGLARLSIYNKKYLLNKGYAIYAELRENCFNTAFLFNLYETPFSELFGPNSAYSNLLISGYCDGAKVEMVNMSEVNHQKEVSSAKSTLSCALKSSVLGIGAIKTSIKVSESDKREMEKYLSTSKTFVELIGGSPNSLSISDFFTLNCDISGWLRSLSDSSKFTFVELDPHTGIIRLDELLQEENFKQRIRIDNLNKVFSEPSILITWGMKSMVPNFVVEGERTSLFMYLKTRHGDYISLRPINKNDDTFWSASSRQEFDSKADIIANAARRFYKLDIRSQDLRRHYKEISPIFWAKSIDLPPTLKPFVTVDFSMLDESKCVKVQHPIYKWNGCPVTYLLFKNGAKRYAYTVYSDHILDAYGIRDAYEQAPLVDWSDIDLSSYRLVGL